MIFWILITVAAIAILGSIAYAIYDDDPTWIAFGILAACVLGVVLVIGALASSPTSTETEAGERTVLRSLNVSESTTGTFFLGSGSANGRKTVEYISEKTTEDGTWSEVGSVNARDARIFEDRETAPYMIERITDMNNYLWFPWAQEYVESYDFHVPAGSVSSDIRVALE
jgi:hypothetical protein